MRDWCLARHHVCVWHSASDHDGSSGMTEPEGQQDLVAMTVPVLQRGSEFGMRCAILIDPSSTICAAPVRNIAPKHRTQKPSSR